eukprot:357618-Chlamydomonas_euryale.AAC.1
MHLVRVAHAFYMLRHSRRACMPDAHAMVHAHACCAMMHGLCACMVRAHACWVMLPCVRDAMHAGRPCMARLHAAWERKPSLDEKGWPLPAVMRPRHTQSCEAWHGMARRGMAYIYELIQHEKKRHAMPDVMTTGVAWHGMCQGARSMEHGAWGMEHEAWGMGHGALGVARHGLAWPDLAWHGPGLAWPGLAWPGLAWHAMNLHCAAKGGTASGMAERRTASNGTAWHGLACNGMACICCFWPRMTRTTCLLDVNVSIYRLVCSSSRCPPPSPP